MYLKIAGSGRSDRLVFQRNVMCRNDRKDWTEDEVTKVVVEEKNGLRFWVEEVLTWQGSARGSGGVAAKGRSR